MNIVVFGGGKVGKFGHDFCLRARSEGHKVIIFSHKLNGTNDPDQHVINYSDLDQCLEVFNNQCAKLGKIDLVLFNQVGNNYPSGRDLYQKIKPSLYTESLNCLVIIPHLFISTFAAKFHQGTKVINMTTTVALDYRKDTNTAILVGYAGSKAWSTHMIQSFANYKDSKAIFFSIAPSMNYDLDESKKNYPIWFNSLYNLIFLTDKNANGKIISAWNLKEHNTLKTEFIKNTYKVKHEAI